MADAAAPKKRGRPPKAAKAAEASDKAEVSVNMSVFSILERRLIYFIWIRTRRPRNGQLLPRLMPARDPSSEDAGARRDPARRPVALLPPLRPSPRYRPTIRGIHSTIMREDELNINYLPGNLGRWTWSRTSEEGGSCQERRVGGGRVGCWRRRLFVNTESSTERDWAWPCTPNLFPQPRSLSIIYTCFFYFWLIFLTHWSIFMSSCVISVFYLRSKGNTSTHFFAIFVFS